MKKFAKKFIKTWLLCSFLLISLTLINGQGVKGATAVSSTDSSDSSEDEALLDIDYTVYPGVDTIMQVFQMPRDGSVTLNLGIIDISTITTQMDLTLYQKDSEGQYSIVVTTITGLSSSKGIEDLNIDLSKGDYYINCKQSGDSTFTFKLKVTLNELPALPAPENITKLTLIPITKESDIKDTYNKIVLGGELNELVLPFTAKRSGKLGLYMAENGDYNSSPTVQVYQDKECTKKLGEALKFNSSEDSNAIYVGIGKAGTYYVKFKLNDSYSRRAYSNFKVKLYLYNTADTTLKNKVTYISYQDADSKVISYKVTVPKNGLITLDYAFAGQEDVTNASFQLYDSKNKKVLSKTEYETSGKDEDVTYSSQKYYMVKKGTYYIKTKITSGIYGIKYTFGARSDNAGSTKAKAKKLNTGGASVSGYIMAADSTSSADWYTFTLKSDKYVEALINYKSDGTIKYDLLDSKGKVVYSSTLSEGYKELYIYNPQYYEKGKYYLKVYKANKNSSISYSVRIAE